MSRKIELVNVWTQILTSIAVIGGLGLVVWELQITRQASWDMYALITVSDDSADSSAVYGERAAEVMAKACFEPDSLSNAELFMVSKYFENKLNRVFQTLWQSNFAGNQEWKQISPVWLSQIFSFPQGQLFLEQFVEAQGHEEVEITQLIREMIAKGNHQSCTDLIGGLRITS